MIPVSQHAYPGVLYLPVKACILIYVFKAPSRVGALFQDLSPSKAIVNPVRFVLAFSGTHHLELVRGKTRSSKGVDFWPVLKLQNMAVSV